MAGPVILELAVNGATPRHRNRHVPRTPAEITEAATATTAQARRILGVPSATRAPLAFGG